MVADMGQQEIQIHTQFVIASRLCKPLLGVAQFRSLLLFCTRRLSKSGCWEKTAEGKGGIIIITIMGLFTESRRLYCRAIRRVLRALSSARGITIHQVSEFYVEPGRIWP
jgi:hypothetical protein